MNRKSRDTKLQLKALKFTANDMDNSLFTDLERVANDINVEITKNAQSQKFRLVFTDYHKFNFQSG